MDKNLQLEDRPGQDSALHRARKLAIQNRIRQARIKDAAPALNEDGTPKTDQQLIEEAMQAGKVQKLEDGEAVGALKWRTAEKL